jgi:hypothetical protein
MEGFVRWLHLQVFQFWTDQGVFGRLVFNFIWISKEFRYFQSTQNLQGTRFFRFSAFTIWINSEFISSSSSSPLARSYYLLQFHWQIYEQSLKHRRLKDISNFEEHSSVTSIMFPIDLLLINYACISKNAQSTIHFVPAARTTTKFERFHPAGFLNLCKWLLIQSEKWLSVY